MVHIIAQFQIFIQILTRLYFYFLAVIRLITIYQGWNFFLKWIQVFNVLHAVSETLTYHFCKSYLFYRPTEIKLSSTIYYVFKVINHRIFL